MTREERREAWLRIAEAKTCASTGVSAYEVVYFANEIMRALEEFDPDPQTASVPGRVQHITDGIGGYVVTYEHP